ncbi:MAG: lysylphosphatidylglycerol synthase domain-containing protein [candidate division WOR-3 bacterium]
MSKLILSKIRKIIGILIVLILFYYLGKSLYQNWQVIEAAKLSFNLYYLIISYVFILLNFLLAAYTWQRNLFMLKENISLITAVRINALATLPKYAPGKVWGILGKVYLAKKEGITEQASVISISLETILVLLGGVILFLLTASPVVKGKISYTYYLFIIPICLIITYPKILIGITNFFLRIFKRPLITFMPKYLQIIELLTLYTLSWVLQGIGIYFLIKSFYPIALNKVLLIAGLHAFSWVIGFVSIITPAGLGIKEGIFSYFLKFIFPSGIAILIALLVRIWATIAELLFFLAFAKNIKKYL